MKPGSSAPTTHNPRSTIHVLAFFFLPFAFCLPAEVIFFSSDRAAPGSKLSHIWMIHPDGSGLQQVTSGQVRDYHPRLSPDGRTLAFSRAPASDPERQSVWVRDLATGRETSVTGPTDYPATPLVSLTPAWSPDGSTLAFARQVYRYLPEYDPQCHRLWTLRFRPSVGAPRQLSPAQGRARLAPSWSPRGGTILYQQDVDSVDPFAIFTVTLDGVERELIPHIGGERLPECSPDGRSVAWHTYRHSDAGDVYVAEILAPLRTQMRVTPYSGFYAPAWSPDSSRLVMYTVGTADLWVIGRDGRGLRQLTSGPAGDSGPWWSRVRVPVK